MTWLKLVRQKCFIRHIANRYHVKSNLSWKYCKKLANSTYKFYVEDEGIEFGHLDYSWEKSDAFEIADADMSYWER